MLTVIMFPWFFFGLHLTLVLLCGFATCVISLFLYANKRQDRCTAMDTCLIHPACFFVHRYHHKPEAAGRGARRRGGGGRGDYPLVATPGADGDEDDDDGDLSQYDVEWARSGGKHRKGRRSKQPKTKFRNGRKAAAGKAHASPAVEVVGGGRGDHRIVAAARDGDWMIESDGDEDGVGERQQREEQELHRGMDAAAAAV